MASRQLVSCIRGLQSALRLSGLPCLEPLSLLQSQAQPFQVACAGSNRSRPGLQAHWLQSRALCSLPNLGLHQDASLDSVEPYALAQDEVSIVSERLRSSITTNIPVLGRAADYFFRKGVEGKRLRPTILLLLSSALSSTPLSPDSLKVDLSAPRHYPQDQRRRQQRIAEIAEMIHVASLLHDDVLDDASTRRGILSLNASAGNKLAILAGDFLLARASVSLAALRNTQIVELLSEVLEHLVTGEIMQMAASPEQLVDLEHYLQKSYYKTASLMANSCRAVAILSDAEPEVCELAWKYGRHLGLAFQIVDDILDLSASSTMLGKPALNDLKSGLATAPVLYAAQQFPELRPLIQRKFKQEGDVAEALMLLEQSQGMRQAKELAAHHALAAADMVKAFPAPQHDLAVLNRKALMSMTEKVLSRTK